MKLDPSATAFLFPGQGSQSLGMGAELARSEPLAAEIFEQADDLLGYSLSEIMWQGPEEKLNSTEHTQPALLVHSVAVHRVFKQIHPDFSPRFVAGHSLGEFSALVAAGSLDFADALNVVKERGLAMKKAGEEQPGGMAAVLGLDTPTVAQACQQATDESEGGVWVANDNCPGQVVISGADDALDVASNLLEEAGARRVLRLAVSIAAHSPYMQVAQERFQQALEAADFKDPVIPVIGNVGATPLETIEQVKDDVEAQLMSTVRWTDSIQFMLDEGATNFVELGSGDVLTGLVKRIERSSNRYQLDSPDSFVQLSQ
ncbi:MAG: ACP S-malonyltransferase [Anaerolineales bacterium]